LIPTLEALVAIGTLAEEQSWISTGWPGESPAPNFSDGDGDAVVVMRDDIRHLHEAPYVPIRCTKLDFDPVRVAIQMLGLANPEREPLNAPNPKIYVRHLEQLVRARQVLVVVTHDVRLPQLEAGTQFVTGRVYGAAVLFDIASRELRGAFEIHVENRSQIKGTERTIDDKLRHDLAAQFSLDVVRLIGDRFPAGRPPATLGYV
jgi:hypothetical protein